MRFMCLAAAISASVTLSSAEGADASSDSGLWIGAEYLHWTTKGDRLPALVTTSPAGTPATQAGVLGAPGTEVLFGNESVQDSWRSGARAQGGYWFDPQHTEGIEAQVLFLGNHTTGLSASSSGSPILAQPFTNVGTGLPDASLVAFPGRDTGSILVRDSSQLFGAGGAYRKELCDGCAFGSVSALIGYRYLHLHDRLRMDDAITPTSAFIPAGTAIANTDAFQATNNFHGLDLGLVGDVANGPWRLNWLAKLALGGTFARGDIDGSTTITIPGNAAIVSAGGLYTEPTNI